LDTLLAYQADVDVPPDVIPNEKACAPIWLDEKERRNNVPLHRESQLSLCFAVITCCGRLETLADDSRRNLFFSMFKGFKVCDCEKKGTFDHIHQVTSKMNNKEEQETHTHRERKREIRGCGSQRKRTNESAEKNSHSLWFFLSLSLFHPGLLFLVVRLVGV